MKAAVRRLIPLLLLLGVVIAVFAVWRVVAEPDAPVLPTATVEIGDIENTVTAVGSVQPKEYVDVGTQVSGRVERVFVEINDRVAKGDPIAEIDASTYEADLQSGRANIDNLEAQLQQQKAEAVLARQQLARNRRMAESRAVSQDTVEQAEASLAVADAQVLATQAQLAAARADLERDETNLGYTKIYAPIAGTVVSQTTLEGQTVNANQSTPVIVQVANLDVMTVWAQVTEADIMKIQPQMKAYFTTLGNPDRRWSGTVRQIQPTPEVVNDVVLYNVLIDVSNERRQLLPQMTVQVFFVLGEAHDVPVVPMTALTPLAAPPGARPPRGTDAAEPDGERAAAAPQDGERAASTAARGRRYQATVVTPQGQVSREVRIGVTSRLQAQVLSGLEVGDVVVLQNGAAAPAQRQDRGPPRMGPRL